LPWRPFDARTRALTPRSATQRQFHASLEREGKDFDANVEAELYKIGPLLSRMPQYRDKALRLAKRMRAVRERVDRIKRAAAKLRREATQSGAAASAATAPASGPAGEGGVASDSELP
jgi:hypothetical protein